VTFKDSFIANALPGMIHSGCWTHQNSTPSRRNASLIIEGNRNHFDDLVDGIPILDATAFVHMAAIEKNCGHDRRQVCFLSLLVDLCQLRFAKFAYADDGLPWPRSPLKRKPSGGKFKIRPD
jgi:hypothetical protein